MKKSYLIIWMVGLVLAAGSFVNAAVPCNFSDDFEDGVIDANLWVIGGEKRSYLPQPGGGNWTYSHDEIIDTDGYLRMRVEGPTSGLSYGAEAWVRTVYNFNDGKSHLVNFTWEADVVIEGHYDYYHIHITDGNAPPPVGDHAWHMSETPGTIDLLWHIDDSNNLRRGWSLRYGMEPNSMSITITSNGIARLYSESNATGELLHEEMLDIGKPWYIQFLVIDATSAGFPAGDDRLNLYDFSSICIPFCDDFEDGVIDANLWVVGGSKGGVGGCGSGGGNWYNEEIIAPDGYLQARATTPASGNTYGSQAWTRTVYNFNDGNDWLINFKWEVDIETVGLWHADHHLIEITDGRTDWSYCLYAHADSSKVLPGTQQLYNENGVEVSPQMWSIYINYANATATLYEGPNRTGPVHSTKSLDKAIPWYVRFITTTATSSGFPAKDCRINLYHFYPTIFECQVQFAGDLNGDCYVDMHDFAFFAADWLACGNPFDPDCSVE